MDVWKAAAERARTHGDVLVLAAGQPSTPAPKPVLRATKAAMDAELFGYTETFGLPDLRETIAEHHRRTYGYAVSPDDVVVTTGSSGAFTLVFLAAFDPGDVVVVARPGYPAYRNTLAALGCRVVELDCRAETRFQPTVAMLEALGEPPKGLVVASPANPTGTMIDPDELAALARWCEAHGTLLISDEIYHGITYGKRAVCALEVAPDALVVNSFSKLYRMPGWRLGWMVVPQHLVARLDACLINMFLTPPALAQHAALVALDEKQELQRSVEIYARNRERLITRLPELGLEGFSAPDGAFYLYVDVGHLTRDSLAFCMQLVEETGVSLAPGIDFDPVRGQRFVRLSFAVTTDEVERALERLQEWLRKRRS